MADQHLQSNCNNFKTDATYALGCREACRPDECVPTMACCWVVLGTAASLNTIGTPRCLACNGKIKIEHGRKG